jgi:hypothetical protein
MNVEHALALLLPYVQKTFGSYTPKTGYSININGNSLVSVVESETQIAIRQFHLKEETTMLILNKADEYKETIRIYKLERVIGDRT